MHLLSLGAGRGSGFAGMQQQQQQRGAAAPDASSDAEWLQRLRQAAAMRPTAPGSSQQPAAAGGGRSSEPAFMQDRNLPKGRDVCGHLLHFGLSTSKLFDVREVQLGHVYGRLNGRMQTAFIPGSLIDSEVQSGKPEGFNWSPNPAGSGPAGPGPGFGAAGPYVNPAAGGGASAAFGVAGGSSSGARGSGGASSSNSSGARGSLGAGSSSGGAGVSGGSSGMAGVSSDGVPRLPVQFHKPLPASGDYCFKSPVWAAARFKPAVLRQPYRQVGRGEGGP
jgi:hypothetical protein